MQISDVGVQRAGLATYPFTGEAADHIAVLNNTDPAADTRRQLESFQTLAGRWRGAAHGERAALAKALTDSPFGQRVHAVLNAFTRAAWPGDATTPPAPQAKVLEAFEALSGADQQIVAAMQVDPSTGSAFASATRYHDRLKSDLDTAGALAAARRPDTVTLSPEAQARLAGETSAAAAPQAAPGAARPEVAAALAAYAKLA